MQKLMPQENSMPTEIEVKGKLISSPKAIAEEYSKHYINKIEDLRKSTPYENFKAINIYKKVIPRVEEDDKFERVTIKEVREYIVLLTLFNNTDSGSFLL